jgi:hypothetical protein
MLEIEHVIQTSCIEKEKKANCVKRSEIENHYG